MQGAVDVGVQFHARGRLGAEEAMQAHAGAGGVELRHRGAQRTDRGSEHHVSFEARGRQAQPAGNLHLAARRARPRRRNQVSEHLGDLRGAVSEGNLDGRDGAFAIAEFRDHPGGAGGSSNCREAGEL